MADCFYQLRVPWFSRYFGMRPVRAGEVGVTTTTTLEGVPNSPDMEITPRLYVLPMGFAFALHWAQRAHENILQKAGDCKLKSCWWISLRLRMWLYLR